MAEQKLIDAKALIKKFEKLKKEANTLRDSLYLDGVLAVIDTAPTVEAKPVVHAHWTGSDGTHCSHCKRSYMDVADADSWESSDIPDFCPYCGAQMDEKEG